MEGEGLPWSSAGSIAMTYSSDSDGAAAARATWAYQRQRQQLQQAPPFSAAQRRQHQQQRQWQPSTHFQDSPPGSNPLPAYALRRSERAPGPGERRSGSTLTMEDSIDRSASADRSVDSTEYSTASEEYGVLNHRQRQRHEVMNDGFDGNSTLSECYRYREAGRGLLPRKEYHEGINGMGGSRWGGSDATPTIHEVYKQLLHLLSYPQLFHESLYWQKELDGGIDPVRGPTGRGSCAEDDEFVSAVDEARASKEDSKFTVRFEVNFDDGLTFGGLKSMNDGNTLHSGERENNETRTTQDKALKFDPNSKDRKGGVHPKEEAPDGSNDPPLPHRIFAPNAEVVLPQAFTASQLFGVERVTGVELEASTGMASLCRLFLRWLALMPEGDHCNLIEPPGLTVMRTSGGGYRVSGAHRVVWRWMNKFPPAGADLDFGDLVSMTVVDVFEADADGRLLSYCPTFDNRAVHKTSEMAERLRQGAAQLKERMKTAVHGPAGKTAVSAGRVGFRAAMVVRNAVRNKMRHRQEEQGQNDAVRLEEDQSNNLSQLHIALDETIVDTGGATALEEYPASSLNSTSSTHSRAEF